MWFILLILTAVHPAAAENPIEKLSRELAELVVEYESLYEPVHVENRPNQSEPQEFAISDFKKEAFLREHITAKVAEIEPFLIKHTAAQADGIKERIKTIAKHPSARRAWFYAGSILGAVAGAVYFVPVAAPFLFVASWFVTAKSMMLQDAAFDDPVYRAQLEARYDRENQMRFYVSYNRALQKLGAKMLPAWTSLDALERENCVALLTTQQLRFLPPGE